MNDRRDKSIFLSVFSGSFVIKTGRVRSVSQNEQGTRSKCILAIRRSKNDALFTTVPYSTVICYEHFKDNDYAQCEKSPVQG